MVKSFVISPRFGAVITSRIYRQVSVLVKVFLAILPVESKCISVLPHYDLTFSLSTKLRLMQLAGFSLATYFIKFGIPIHVYQ